MDYGWGFGHRAWDRGLFLRGLSQAARILCVSNFIQRHLVERYPSVRAAATTVYNGVDGGLFRPGDRAKARARRPFSTSAVSKSERASTSCSTRSSSSSALVCRRRACRSSDRIRIGTRSPRATTPTLDGTLPFEPSRRAARPDICRRGAGRPLSIGDGQRRAVCVSRSAGFDLARSAGVGRPRRRLRLRRLARDGCAG